MKPERDLPHDVLPPDVLPPDLLELDGLERLLERAERDPSVSDELDFTADVVAAAELERARLTLRPAPPARARALPVRSWILAAAASVLFVLALGLWYFDSDGADARRSHASVASLAAPRYVATELRGGSPGSGSPGSGSPDGDDPDLAGDFARAMEPYARGDWQASVRTLEELLQRHPEHGPAHFYLAAACEQLGDVARAEREYERAATSPDALLSAHARLRLALRLHARGELEQARAALSALVEEGGELAPGAREQLEARFGAR